MKAGDGACVKAEVRLDVTWFLTTTDDDRDIYCHISDWIEDDEPRAGDRANAAALVSIWFVTSFPIRGRCARAARESLGELLVSGIR